MQRTLSVSLALALVLSLPAAAAPPAALTLPRAALIVDSPLPPSRAALSVTRQQLSKAYQLLDARAQAPLVKELEVLDREPSPDRVVRELLHEAQQRLRRLALPEVQEALNDAEPYVQLLPPTPSGRALLCAVALRKAYLALLQNDTATAEAELARVLSADPDFTLDQAQEPPPLLALFERVRTARSAVPSGALRVETVPPGAQVVISGVPRGQAPLEVVAPLGRAVLWAVKEGYVARNVTVSFEPQQAGSAPLSVQIQLYEVPPPARVRPLVDALREAAETPLRVSLARTLSGMLHVDTVILAQAAPGGRPQLWAYGAAPGTSLRAAEFHFDLVPATAHARRRLPSWAWGLIGAGAGLLVGGVLTGVVVGTAK